MKLVETNITPDGIVRLRYQSHDGTEWMDFRVKSDRAGETEFLAVVHREALLHLRELIETEIQRLRRVEGRRS